MAEDGGDEQKPSAAPRASAEPQSSGGGQRQTEDRPRRPPPPRGRAREPPTPPAAASGSASGSAAGRGGRAPPRGGGGGGRQSRVRPQAPPSQRQRQQPPGQKGAANPPSPADATSADGGAASRSRAATAAPPGGRGAGRGAPRRPDRAPGRSPGGRGPAAGGAAPGRAVPRPSRPPRTADPHAVKYRPMPPSADDRSEASSSILVPPEEVAASLSWLDADLAEGGDDAVDELLARDGGTNARAAAAGMSYAAYASDLTGHYCKEAHVYSQQGTRQALSYARHGMAQAAVYARHGLAVALSLMSDLLLGCSRGDYTLVRQNLDEQHRRVHRSCFRKPRDAFIHSLVLCTIILCLTSLHRTFSNGKFELARWDSYGFFTDIPEDEWRRAQHRARTSKHHQHADWRTDVDEPGAWYSSNWDPDFTCPQERRVGLNPAGDGPKWVCDPHRIVPAARERAKGKGLFGHRQGSNGQGGCLIYSIGINGGDFEFEVGMRDLLTQYAQGTDLEGRQSLDDRFGVKQHRPSNENGCEIHVFDPAGLAALPARGHMVPPGINYHPWGIKGSHSAHDSLQSGGHDADFKTFRRTVEELGHAGRVVDVLKLDCKMCEWTVYQDLFPSRSGLERIGQILVEVHGSPEEYVEDFFESMREEGYVAFHKEANGGDFGGTAVDYAFVKLREEFFGEGGGSGGGGVRR